MQRIRGLIAIIIVLILAFFEQWAGLDEWMEHKYTSLSIPIFGFHNIVAGQPQNYLDYTNDNLNHFLEYLVSNNYYFLDTVEFYEYFIARKKDLMALTGKKPIMLTFDDGNRSSTQHILKLIQSFNEKNNVKIKVVLFINTIGFDQEGETVRCSDLYPAVQHDQIDVQSHGHSHIDLIQLKSVDLVDELQKANSMLLSCKLKSGLEFNDQTMISSMAYPFNSWDDRVQNYVKQEHEAAYTYTNSVFRWGWHDNSYEIPRIRVYARNSPELLITIAQQAREVSPHHRQYYKSPHRGQRLFMDWL